MDKAGQKKEPLTLVINGEIWIQVNNFQEFKRI